ncbi:OmpA family protein [Xanthocytophaga flava]|uniref:OmpA family protein n=1 Tax=Xanthocytophaga flava TaxID=3048013 RepID=UPI0028D8C59E|nr:OmpA family protein [Xanthocytophaga flavus]MDJ1468533.1 OmpA family protein [Xanthocytophaga flavus]
MKHCILFILLFVAYCADAQSTLWFYDDFDDNHSNWPVSESAENRYALSNGAYTIEVKNSNPYWTCKQISMNPDKDFAYEVLARKAEGDEIADFGIAVLGKNGTVYQFRINSEKQQSWVGSFKKTWKSIVNNTTKEFSSTDYRASASIKKDTALNKLTLRRQGDEIIFLVNDTEVFRGGYSKNFERFNGNFGFVVANKMKMEVEQVAFKQDNATNILPDMPPYLKKESMGAGINTIYDEVIPRIAPDGKTIYYSIKNHPENTGGTSDSDDAWYSQMDENGNWGTRKKLPAPPNDIGSTYVVSALPDNNTLVMNCKYYDDMTVIPEWGLSIIQKTDTGWMLRENIDIPDLSSKSKILEMAMSADQKVIMITLKKKDSYGERDIYVSLKGANGKWGSPFNIGNVVNTKKDESSPFLAADGVSLYFASEGHPGFGSADIFVSRRLDDTWKNWSTPQNLGLGVNTPGWDGYYNIPASGAYAYLTSDQNSLGLLDIIKLNLPEVAKPKPVVIVYGYVLDSQTHKPIQADIVYRNQKTNKELGIATSNPVDGSYKIALPAGIAYTFMAKKRDFNAVTETIDLKEVDKYEEIKRDLYLTSTKKTETKEQPVSQSNTKQTNPSQPTEAEETVSLNDLFFDTNKFALRKESISELDQLVKMLKENPTMAIKIQGHTDNVGNDTYNMALSQNRAKSVVKYLTSKGISTNRLSSQGYGESKPVADNTTKDGRQQNRRVEFVIIKK